MKKITSDGLERAAYQKVKQMILSHKLTPGQKIVQNKLADELGISRTPLRSALQMLEAEHLVESIPRRGVIVRQFSNEEIIEIYDCRIALECTAVRLFTQRASPAVVKKLYDLFAPFVGCTEPIDYQEYRTADIKFHDTIIRQCGNNFLRKLFQQSNLLIYIDRIGLVRPPEETLPEHIAIIESMTNRNPDEAKLHMKKHLIHSQKLIAEQP
ncbi:GntR family transcriptional regulator [Tunicatimonas pelagia]|uniref:GntR family transcriptional regulator n=1 Tax=Tunicatimonas pelagia TaxID=931531 RepID=UPI00266617F9|nr:GntR family transcriptional regulator [Tunicatimonas pelagia]WKN46231.1 GntR family transcriptional regulator [Tunicatimonas pelagia]